jgi:hypothetical protein
MRRQTQAGWDVLQALLHSGYVLHIITSIVALSGVMTVSAEAHDDAGVIHSANILTRVFRVVQQAG